VEEFGLRGEVAVERSARDTRLDRDVLDRHAVQSGAQHQAGRRLENALLGGDGARVGPARERRRLVPPAGAACASARAAFPGRRLFTHSSCSCWRLGRYPARQRASIVRISETLPTLPLSSALNCKHRGDRMHSTDRWGTGQRDTVIAALDRAVAAHPDRTMLDFGGETYSYRDVDSLSTAFAHSLSALG